MSASGGSSNESSRSSSGANKWQKQIYKKLTPYVLGNMFTAPPKYPGQMYVPKTGEESAYMDRVAGLRGGALQNVFEGKIPYEIGPEYAEKFYSESIKPMALKEFQEETLPGIQSAFVGPGYYGSARGMAETKASQDLATELASQRAQLYYQEEMQRRMAQENATNRQLQAEQWATGEQEKAAGLSRTIEQERVMSELQRWLSGEEVGGQRMDIYSPFFQLALSMLSLEGQSRSSSSGTSWNFGAGIFGT